MKQILLLKKNKRKRWNETISDNEAFIEATVDITKLMVERENGLALSVENQYEKGEELSKYPEKS